jgi:hypothetical protein
MKSILCLSAAVCALALSGCANTPTSGSSTAADVVSAVAKFCPLAQTELPQLEAMGIFTGGAAQTYVNVVIPGVNKLCNAASSTPSTADINTIVDDVLPAIEDAINASSLLPTQKSVAIGGIAMMQGALIFATSNAPAPASGVSAQ